MEKTVLMDVGETEGCLVYKGFYQGFWKDLSLFFVGEVERIKGLLSELENSEELIV